MSIRYNYLILSILLTLVGCKESPEKVGEKPKLPVVQMFTVSRWGRKRASFLTSNKDKTLLSWVEEEGDSLTIFNMPNWSMDLGSMQRK